jgi:hypothetical protein
MMRSASFGYVEACKLVESAKWQWPRIKSLTREDIREFLCPTCLREPGQLCKAKSGDDRPTNDEARQWLAQDYMLAMKYQRTKDPRHWKRIRRHRFGSEAVYLVYEDRLMRYDSEV